MRILSWNCNGKFRDKFKYLRPYNADVYVIAECENPANSGGADYRAFTANGFWNMQSKDKGLGIFARSDIALQQLHWDDEEKSFLPVLVNGEVKLVGVWTVKPYTKRLSDYIGHNAAYFDGNTVLMGDFNSSQGLTDKHSAMLHKECVEKLESIGMFSMYHRYHEEEQGRESLSTFYLHKHKDKGYHIDFCFARPECVNKFELLSGENWLEYSDHIPLLLELK